MGKVRKLTANVGKLYWKSLTGKSRVLKPESGNQSGEESEWGRARKWKDRVEKARVGKAKVEKRLQARKC